MPWQCGAAGLMEGWQSVGNATSHIRGGATNRTIALRIAELPLRCNAAGPASSKKAKSKPKQPMIINPMGLYGHVNISIQGQQSMDDGFPFSRSAHPREHRNPLQIACREVCRQEAPGSGKGRALPCARR